MAFGRADVAAAVARGAQPLTGVGEDYDALLDRIGDRRIVLLSEASHGTHEFYRERARNDAHRHLQTKARFHGLDLYSLRASMSAVITYLNAVDPVAASAARDRYSCFDHVVGEGPEYGHSVALNIMVPCEEEVVSELIDLRRRAVGLLARDGLVAEDEFFFAEQNALLVRNAERYYRAMYHGRVTSWNLRDRHMAETLEALVAHLDRQLGQARVVVWEHNSHVGDARACHRHHLPPGHRAREPLVPCFAARPVRRRDPPRPHVCGRALGAQLGVGRRGGA